MSINAMNEEHSFVLHFDGLLYCSCPVVAAVISLRMVPPWMVSRLSNPSRFKRYQVDAF